MAAIDKAQTITELVDRVGDKMDLTINENSTPSIGQVCSWLNEAALLLARYLPPHRLGSLRAPAIAQDDVGARLDLTGNSILRVVGVKKYGTECTVLGQRRMDLVATRYPLVHTVRNPSVCISGESGAVQLQFWPESLGPVEVRGIQIPTKYHNEQSGGSYTWVSDTYSLPAELETAAVNYATIQGKVQDEEPEQVAQLYQMWMQEMGIEQRIPGLGVDSS